MNKRVWTKEEYEYLEASWGERSLPYIAKKLNRSENAIKIKVQRLNLGSFLESGEYITLNQLVIAVKGTNSGLSYISKSWGKERGLPIHSKRVGQNRFRIVYLNDFWKWAEKNKSFINFAKMEPLVLGKEPEWVAEQRKKDFEAFGLQRKDVWTPYEDSRLRILLKQQKYGYAELSQILYRSAGAIQRRCTDLKILDRPVKAENHGEQAAWTDEMFCILAEGITAGDSYMAISQRIGKSEKAIRGKVYNTYLTENMDKVRKMLGGGKWGRGKPEPKVKQALYLSEYRKECKNELSRLVGILRYRMNDLGYGTYWQKDMCMNWDNFKGCKTGQKNCDECVDFRRIQVQHCKRCGLDFYERTENKFCLKCRLARKKKAQRHWCRTQRR